MFLTQHHISNTNRRLIRQRPINSLIAYCLPVCLAVFWASGLAYVEGADKIATGIIQVKVSRSPNPMVQLEARESPLGQILKQIADKTGAIIHYSVLPEAPVTATCVGADVGQVMDCLVAKQIGLVAHKAQKNKPAEFWLLGSSVGSCQAKSIVPIKLSKELETPEQEPLNSEPNQEEIEQTERWLIEAKSKDPSERGMALTNLGLAGLKDDPKVNETLRFATKDKDPNIRIQAITGLMQREGRRVEPEIVDALKDINADVKMAVISNLNDPDLLRIALNDSDPAIRNLATSKIETISHQQEKTE